MLLVFGGTTEGRWVERLLKSHAIPFIYSTKTAIEFDASPTAIYRSGALTSGEITTLCHTHDVKAIVHASHPFAEILHESIRTSVMETGIPVFRIERRYPEQEINTLVHYVTSYQEAIARILTINPKCLLALTGVQTIPRLAVLHERMKVYFRILPRQSSLDMARGFGFPESQLIAEMPSADLIAESRLLQDIQADVVLTKESGESGFLSTKITAAISQGIPIVIITRPPLPNSFIPVSEETELMSHLETLRL